MIPALSLPRSGDPVRFFRNFSRPDLRESLNGFPPYAGGRVLPAGLSRKDAAEKAISCRRKIPAYCGFPHKKALRPRPQGENMSRKFLFLADCLFGIPVFFLRSVPSLLGDSFLALLAAGFLHHEEFSTTEGAACGFAGSLVVHQGKALFGDFSQKHFPCTGGDFLAVQIFQGRRILHGGLAVVGTAITFFVAAAALALVERSVGTSSHGFRLGERFVSGSLVRKSSQPDSARLIETNINILLIVFMVDRNNAFRLV